MTTSQEQFHAERITGIGGSDMPGILGISRFKNKTRMSIWMRKRGLSTGNPAPENESMYWGKVHEPGIVRCYEERTGNAVEIIPEMIRSREYPWLIGHLDAFVPKDLSSGKEIILECKSTHAYEIFNWGNEWTDHIPADYNIQCQHYMIIKEVDVAHIAVLFGGNTMKIYQVARDEELCQIMIREAEVFWDMVQKGIEPEITGDDASDRYVRARFPRDTGEIIVATPKIETMALQRIDLDSQISELEFKKAELDNKIKNEMGVASRVEGDSYNITWTLAKGSSRFNWKAYVDENGIPSETVEKYTTQDPDVRRFRIWPKKEKH